MQRMLRLCLLSLASALLAVVHSPSAGAADVFGFHIDQIAKPGVTPPWHGLAEYTFDSPDGNPAKSITVVALDLDGFTDNNPPVLLKGEDAVGAIGVGTDGNPFPKIWINEGVGIALGQPAVRVEITLKDVSVSRDVLWDVAGTDASGKEVEFTGKFHGGGADDAANQTFVIDQAALAATPAKPADGFAPPVKINAVFLKSLWFGATLPDMGFGETRFDQSFYLVGVQATGF